ncbi:MULTISPECIES: TrmH family RNA methyltransferase [unclassified Luteococcus]|uniref:TrmH family RNA methyltransferase n=1 Tax=unclassified Luteococcus TaxID=2639923 RepID=UPI00313E79CE
MATFVEITDPADPRLRDYVSLRDTSLRHSMEAAEGLFIAEGDKVIRRAIEAGYRPRSFLLAPRWAEELADLLEGCDAEVYVVSFELAEQVTGFHVHRGALASMERQTRHTLDDLLDARRLVVVEDIVDHSNVGAILRSAAGLGWDGVLLAPRAADPLYRRSVKTSMGAVFSLPWARMQDWEHDLERLKRAGFTIVALALRDDSISLDQLAARVAPGEKLAVLMGTEGAGLSEHWLAQADAVVRIPMGHGVDSLNVAAATAVVCYVLRP